MVYHEVKRGTNLCDLDFSFALKGIQSPSSQSKRGLCEYDFDCYDIVNKFRRKFCSQVFPPRKKIVIISEHTLLRIYDSRCDHNLSLVFLVLHLYTDTVLDGSVIL